MKVISKYSFMLIALTSTSVFAAGGAHHEPSIKDLFYPTINFVVLVGFMIWKLKKPMADMFNKNALDIESLMTSASKKNKDAEERLKDLNAKMANLPIEISKIQKDYANDITNFIKIQAEETQGVIARTKRDFENKLDGERNELIEKLNEDLINNVVAKTQKAINESSEMKKRATSNIVSELR
jgi:F-type H+-transporting ATPase subunit b